MRVIREIASAGHRARAEMKIKVRQPLAEVVLVGDFSALVASGDEGTALLRDELNVKSVVILSEAKNLGARDSSSPSAPQNDEGLVWVEVPGGKIGLNVEITEELQQEGIVRDLIRAVQDLRRQANYQFDDVITLTVVTDDVLVRAALEKFLGMLKDETKSADVRFERSEADASTELAVTGVQIWVGVRKP
jgi:isoleucyl-tRNA synthetase